MSAKYSSMFADTNQTIVLLKRLGTILLHFTRRSTIHGLNHLAQARSVKRRLFWLIISVTASIGFCVNLFFLVDKFVQTPVLTNTFHDHNNFTYPDISFCISNPIRLPAVGTRKYEILLDQIHRFNTVIEPAFRNRFNRSTNRTDSFYKMDLADYLYISKNVTYTHPPWSAVVTCTFMQFPCSWKHFDVHFIWPYGNCFTFNVSKMNRNLSRDAVRDMKLNGFRPDFRIIIYKALNRLNLKIHDPFNDITKPSGVLAMIHEIETFPHISESFVVDAYTQVDLKITIKSHLQSLRKCNKERRNYTYCDYSSDQCASYQGKSVDCIFEMIQNKVASKCHCQLHSMPIMLANSHLPLCYRLMIDEIDRAESIIDCLRTNIREIDKESLDTVCYTDLCVHPSFTTVVSHSKYPAVHDRQTHQLWLGKLKDLEDNELRHYGRSDLFSKAIKLNHSSIVRKSKFLENDRNSNTTFKTIADVFNAGRGDLIDESFINQNFMLLRIVPSSLFMDHIEETEEYPLSRLLSDIGGCVGLWVGASLITVFEFFDLLLDFSDVLRVRPPNMLNRNNQNKNAMGNNLSDGQMKSEDVQEDLVIENIESMMVKMLVETNKIIEIDPGGPICNQLNQYNDLVLKNMSFDSLLFDSSDSEYAAPQVLGVEDTDIISNV